MPLARVTSHVGLAISHVLSMMASASGEYRKGAIPSSATTRLATIVDIGVRPKVSSVHQPLLLREHQVQVLNRSAGCAFSEIIENRR